jgi:hypothetical protein
LAYAYDTQTTAQTDKLLVSPPASTKQVAVYGWQASCVAAGAVTLNSAVPEVTTVDVGAASGGTWTLTAGGQTSGTINHNANAATVEAAVEGITGITAATVTGAGTTGDPWVITLDDPVGAIVVSGTGASLTPSDTLTVTETTAGVTTPIRKVHLAANANHSAGPSTDFELIRAAAGAALSYTSAGAGDVSVGVQYRVRDTSQPDD